MKRIEIHCRECHDRGLFSIGAFGGELIIFPCGCQDPSDPDSRHNKLYDCAPCGGTGRVSHWYGKGYHGDRVGWEGNAICKTCGGCGRTNEPLP